MRSSKKKEDVSDFASELGEPRTEGSNARVFSSMINSAGFIPHHKEPPRYIRVKLHNKKVKEFDRMFLAQELVGTRPPDSTKTDDKPLLVTVSTASQGRMKTATGGAIWTTEFSKDGKYMAAGGRDRVVRVWQVISTAEDRGAQEEEEARHGGEGERLSAPVFLEKPVQEFTGHTGEILDLSWSKNNFLLSTSMDKTVRLWHISRQECLCTFKHKELVSKVAFHPKDDRFFLAGCLDATLRLWSIPDKNVAFSAQLSDMITAVAFSPDGKMAIAGLLSGFCFLLETEGLKALTQIHVRSSRGRNAKGSKITGIVSMVSPNASRPGDAVVLVTSTDARVRLYNLRDKTLECKFKGHEHGSSQLSASFSDDGKYVICGSESRKVFIWSATNSDSVTKDRYPCETFDAHGEIVTTAIFAPTKTRQLLGSSGDPIYDLCNPPPITLMSLEETLASQSGMSNNTLPADDASQPSHPPQPTRPRPEESPAYIARSTHYDGNIIVTSDDTGIIKVFRQDCAANKRRHESWETGSSLGRKLGANSTLLGRSGSIITRTSISSAAHSRRESVSQPYHTASAAATPQLGGNSDRINSWRHGIEGGIMATPARSERSISPNKASRASVNSPGSMASDARKQPYAVATSSPLSSHFGANASRAAASMSPALSSFPSTRVPDKQASAAESDDQTSTIAGSTTAHAAANADVPGAVTTGTETRNETKPESQPESKAVPNDPTRKIEDDEHAHDPAFHMRPHALSMTFKSNSGEDEPRLDPAGASYGFWNLNKWKGIAGIRASLSSISVPSTGPSISHATHPTGEQATPTDAAHSTSTLNSRGSSDSKPDKSDSGKATSGRRRSLGVNVIGKSPLSHGETVGDSTAAAEDEACPSKREAGSERQSRQKSAAGLLSYLTPSLTATSEGAHATNHLQPVSRSHSPYARSGSIISRLSSELTSSNGETDSEGDEMCCTKCGGRDFKARRVNGVQKLQCSRCGKVVDDAAKQPVGASSLLHG